MMVVVLEFLTGLAEGLGQLIAQLIPYIDVSHHFNQCMKSF